MAKRARTTRRSANPVSSTMTRVYFIVAIFALWFAGIGARLVHLQVNEHEELRGKAVGQRRVTVREKQPRGTIFDRSNRVLAITLKVKSLYADPFELEDIDRVAADVARVTQQKTAEVAARIRDAKAANRKFVVLAPKLDDEEVRRINEAFAGRDTEKADQPQYRGLHWTTEQRRSYPNASLAAHVLGFSNADDVGSAGIEQSQEQNLRGAVIKGWRDRDRLGRVYDQSEEERREPPKDIVLTLSHSIQYKVEQALAKGVRNSRAKSGMAIAMDPKTGEILAMANYPTFDPNKYNDFNAELFSNRAIHDSYSPGSVFKLITYGSAINEGAINPNGQVDCSQGFIEVAGRRFNDPHATKVMGYDEAFAVSSNVAAIKTAISAGRENFYQYSQKFGFGAATGIELPAETGGIFRAPKQWNGDSLASLSIGYEINVSALQIISAYATIANDGIRVQPHIIKEIRQEGEVVSTTEAGKTQVVTADTARFLKRMMKEVVTRGTGRRAQPAGFTAGGKTGTAWKYDDKLKAINSNKYVSSFVGMAPYDDPRIVIAVVLDEPNVAARDGGQVAAPVFREIAEQVLPELGVAADQNLKPVNVADTAIPKEAEAMSGKTTDNRPAETETDPTKDSKVKPGVPARPSAGASPVKKEAGDKKTKPSNGKSGDRKVAVHLRRYTRPMMFGNQRFSLSRPDALVRLRLGEEGKT